MKFFSLPDVLDVLFYSVAVWFLSFGILRYYRLEPWLCTLFAVLFALLTGVFCAMLLYGKRKKKVVGKREQEARDALLLHLALDKEERVRAAMLEAYAADGRETHCSGETLEVNGELFVPLFTMEPVPADEVASLIKKYGERPFTVACNALSPEAEKLLLSFGKHAVKGDEVYALFARTETIPTPLICGEIPRRTAKQKMRRSFSKRNSRPFFVSGILLLVMSLFTFFPVYYLISGCLLLIGSILVRAFGYAEG